MLNRAKENLELTRRKLAHASNFFAQGETAEAVHYIWVVFENCINIVKDVKSDDPLYAHSDKENAYFRYYTLFFFKKDYSKTFAVLLKLRIRADFGEYGNAPRLPEINTVKAYLDEAASLFSETEALVKKAESARK